MNDFLEEHQFGLMLLRIAVVFGFFVGTVSVLHAFVSLVTYFYIAVYGSGIDPVENPEWIQLMQELEHSKIPFLLLNLYNIVMWNGVIILTIWLFRLHDWARKALGYALGFDMILTVGHLIWLVSQNQLRMESPVFFILLNAVQVGVIVMLSHPEVIKLTQWQAALRNIKE